MIFPQISGPSFPILVLAPFRSIFLQQQVFDRTATESALDVSPSELNQ
jgi:hypothetical protein